MYTVLNSRGGSLAVGTNLQRISTPPPLPPSTPHLASGLTTTAVRQEMRFASISMEGMRFLDVYGIERDG